MSIRVNVLMGGPSAEHDVSLRSGFEVMTNLDKSKYTIRAVVINKKKEFFFCDIKDNKIPETSELATPQLFKKFSGPFTAQDSAPVWKGCSVVFLALHGAFGEDGTLQGFLDIAGIPYYGSGVLGSAVAMDKIISKYLYLQNGLTVPPYSIYGKNHPETTIETIVNKHGFPCFCKCPQSGSSKLMGKADSKESLVKLLGELEKDSVDILVETTIEGPEFSCGVIEMPDGTLKVLPPIEIRPVNSDFFDYDAKYSDGASVEIVPAPQSTELLTRIEQIAIVAHKILGCRGVSRTDMLYKNDQLFVLETNTLPGMTSNSLLPKAFKAIGGSYSELLDIFIKSAINKGTIGIS